MHANLHAHMHAHASHAHALQMHASFFCISVERAQLCQVTLNTGGCPYEPEPSLQLQQPDPLDALQSAAAAVAQGVAGLSPQLQPFGVAVGGPVATSIDGAIPQFAVVAPSAGGFASSGFPKTAKS